MSYNVQKLSNWLLHLVKVFNNVFRYRRRISGISFNLAVWCIACGVSYGDVLWSHERDVLRGRFIHSCTTLRMHCDRRVDVENACDMNIPAATMRENISRTMRACVVHGNRHRGTRTLFMFVSWTFYVRASSCALCTFILIAKRQARVSG